MFCLIRMIMGGILIIGSIMFIKRSKLINKRKGYLISVMIGLFFTIVSAFIPLENAFFTFSSVESAYKYVSIDNSDVSLVVSGVNSDFVVGDKINSYVYLIIPKMNDGWKIATGVNTKRVIQKISNGVVIYVYQYKDTDDFFITVLDTNGGTCQITDNRESKFVLLERSNGTLNKTFVTYYTHIQNLNDQYCINVNGEEIVLLE